MESSQRTTNQKPDEVRKILCNIPNIDAFINKRTATYIGKISRSSPESYPVKFSTAWIHGKRKNGAPQLTCNNSFAKVIEKKIPADKPLLNKQAPLKEWLPLAKNESNWLEYIDAYFKSCRNIDYDELNNPNSRDETDNGGEMSLSPLPSLSPVKHMRRTLDTINCISKLLTYLLTTY